MSAFSRQMLCMRETKHITCDRGRLNQTELEVPSVVALTTRNKDVRTTPVYLAYVRPADSFFRQCSE